ncbi:MULTISPECIES: NAD-dependent epimerase/dehydratase family protein [unclassified Nocardioides]|uniref:NAD-dependent epimerase/dehydratase family protein n=1 Tax=unclassified Nocardioides TaxID=2615069 RepID=UPI0006FF600F|nr:MULTISPECIES: NAD-dependent epimerase/dehydratase family protein [unclassified Nocardioides]KRA39218.1 epimerase [Nocardioides sp. Root614]KRA93177.1 epimerase [Nocardioides sp. Root682]
MRLLVLGGTRFLSHAVAADAVRRGHEVVCANRGQSGNVPPGASLVRWDRSDPAPDALTDDGPFDAVIDIARQPSHVRHALDAVADAHWVFVSSISVYADDADPSGPGVGPLKTPIAEDVDLATDPEAYGGLKVSCEQLVQDGAASAAVIRPGLIVGPGDPTGRFSYWARRSLATGEVLGPGDPADLVEVIDVRDLATWLVDLAERRTTGTFDAIGAPVPFADLLRDALPDAEVVWVDQEFLSGHAVEPWAGPNSIPLWLPRPEYDGMLAHDAAPAVAAGLVLRPVADTTRDTRSWLEADPAARIDGITVEREAQLLAAWKDR